MTEEEMGGMRSRLGESSDTRRSVDNKVSSRSPLAADVFQLQTMFVNAYAVATDDGSYVLIDSGIPGFAGQLRKRLNALFGHAAPKALILTHGHFDHAGNALALARHFNIPIYAHHLELPYLTGKSSYAPADPTPGGAISFLSRFFSTAGHDFSGRIFALPENGSVPHLPDWRSVHTPGHTAGHCSFFREFDSTLIAGDAVVTMDMDSWTSTVSEKQELGRPPTPLTPDWTASLRSIRKLAALKPRTIAAGHGRPMSGPRISRALEDFSHSVTPPAGGRYGHDSVRYNHDGSVQSIPPPVPDPLPRRLLSGALLGVVAWKLVGARRRSARLARLECQSD